MKYIPAVMRYIIKNIFDIRASSEIFVEYYKFHCYNILTYDIRNLKFDVITVYSFSFSTQNI
jgi:hypothetical protein